MSADAGAVPAPGSDDEGDDPEVCLVCGKPGRGQPCDDCLAELDNPTMRPRTGAGGAHAE